MKLLILQQDAFVQLLSSFPVLAHVILPPQQHTGVSIGVLSMAAELNLQVPRNLTYRGQTLEIIPDDQNEAAHKIFGACTLLRNLHWSDSSLHNDGPFWWIRHSGSVKCIRYQFDYEGVTWPE
jgi:hypothetical protein